MANLKDMLAAAKARMLEAQKAIEEAEKAASEPAPTPQPTPQPTPAPAPAPTPAPAPAPAPSTDVVVDDRATVKAGGSVVIALFANDKIQPISATIISHPKNGSLSAGPDAYTVTYKPNEGFTGTDSFVYEATDGNVTDQATVTITVEAAEPAPAPQPTPAPKPEPRPAVKYRWNPADGTYGEASPQIENASQGSNAVRPVTMNNEKWLEFFAPSFSTGSKTAKCDIELKRFFDVKEGDLVRLSMEVWFQNRTGLNDLFWADLETSTDDSVGTRYKLRDNGLVVFSADKLGVKPVSGSGSIAGGGLLVLEQLCHTSKGRAVITLGGKEVGRWENIPTMKGSPSKAQIGITANSTGRAQVMRARKLMIEVL